VSVSTDHWVFKVIAALIPLLIGALVTIAWQNSYRITIIEHKQEALRNDLDQIKHDIEPRTTLLFRLDRLEQDVKRLQK
jgi:uncharacterized membrane-anchored protein YhcB (DUF1043 family)